MSSCGKDYETTPIFCTIFYQNSIEKPPLFVVVFAETLNFIYDFIPKHLFQKNAIR